MILSTGMSTLAEVADALSIIEGARKTCNLRGPMADVVTVLHCTSNYPTALEDVNLQAMLTLGKEFNLPVGFSDHTDGILAPVAAVALGAKVIEKHFTIDRNLPGPDHRASIEPADFAEMVRQIRSVTLCLGDGLKIPRPSELPVRSLVRRSVVAAKLLPVGHVVTESDLWLRRPGNGLPAAALKTLIGRRTTREIAAGRQLRKEDLS
jgi:N,N'-diacetyllegionaminate synthase